MMKEYNLILLENEEVQVLQDFAHSNNIVIKPIPFPGDIDIALEEFDCSAHEVFYYEDNHVVGLYFYKKDLIKFPKNLGKLTFLKFLEFYECPIQEFPNSFKNLQNLEFLDFFNDPEYSPVINLDLPDVFLELKKLKSVFIDGKFNVYFPPSFFKMENLETLRLRYCLFSYKRLSFMINFKLEEPEILLKYVCEFPDDLRKLRSLQTLELYFLELGEVPKCLLDLTKLIELDLSFSNEWSYTELKNIDIVFELSSLKKLNLSYCKLKSIPKTIGSLKYLRELNLAWNHLKEIPVEIKNCPQLEKLYLYHNHFDENFKTWIKSVIPLNNLKYLTINEELHNLLPKELIEKQDLIIKKL